MTRRVPTALKRRDVWLAIALLAGVAFVLAGVAIVAGLGVALIVAGVPLVAIALLAEIDSPGRKRP